ncbi:MAG: GtrA family protein [Gammaproteobacteria bacterium]|nr:MAG: GtrA family protein [Gammaproteobacteria bacterium]
MHKEFLTPQFLRFLVSGGIAAAANFGSRMVYEYWFGLSYSSAIIFAYFTGMVVAFTLFKTQVFEPSQHSNKREAIHFCIINGLAVMQTWCISILLAEYLLPVLSIGIFRKEIAHAIGIGIPVFTSFLGHKYFTFKKHQPKIHDNA